MPQAQALRDPHTTIAMELRTVVNAYKRVLGRHLLKKKVCFLLAIDQQISPVCIIIIINKFWTFEVV